MMAPRQRAKRSRALTPRDRFRFHGAETRVICACCAQSFVYMRHIGRMRRYCGPVCAAEANREQTRRNMQSTRRREMARAA